jgi:hypothetical protein
MEKICKDCKVLKPLDEFHNMKHGKDGKQIRCKPCAIERSKKRYRENVSIRLQVALWAQTRRVRNQEIIDRFLIKFCCQSCNDIKFLNIIDSPLAKKKVKEYINQNSRRVREKLYRCKVKCSKCNEFTYEGELIEKKKKEIRVLQGIQ